ncbi:MAG TPA: hypothetical protein PLG66_12125, partial [Calditrichia bacterium]|nr:hypothetical protein [Calditrichia bacterium]
MKFRNVFIALGMIGMLTGGYAREAGSPKAMGAGFAKLSGQAQLELMVDRWRSQAAIRGNASLQGLSAATLREPAELLVAGESAEVHFEDGSLVRLQRSGETWVISSVVQAQAREVDETPAAPAYLVAGGNFTAGETFVARSISEEHHIERLSKTVTRQNLDRELFGAPEKSAAYYAATYRNQAPFVTASYVQFVIDPAWDRLMYGSLENWIKSYGDLRGPSAITVDPQGRVFVGESGRNRISVLQLSGDGANAELVFRYAIEEVGVPTDLAHFDNGTPLDISDDALYMVDAASGELKRYDLSESGAVEAGSWDLFVSPTLVQVGRSNGSSNSLVYVVDEVGKRLQQFDLAGGQPLLMGTHTAGNDQYFSALKADHFGHLYAVDHMNSRIEKFSADLELLDRSGDRETYQGLTGLDLPFGKITIEGEGTYWSGFDQLFTLERWSENSGAQRRQLGLAIRNGELVADADFAGITGNYRLTDVAEVTVRVRNADGELIRTVPGGWQNAG